ncbi:MAG: outer membrane protein assembly factor BamD [Bdellovibrionales bacterium]|nr:outer membrane protein assembly factor BamD [Bdellovibrionales bacterium]
MRSLFFCFNFVLFSGILTFISVGCSTADKINADTPEGAFAIGNKFEKDERYEEAISQYNDVSNKFPYSSLALEAKLRIADIYFKRESYIEAQTSYEIFKEFHPRHPRIDYVTFQLALSYFHQLPDSIDRDLSIANKAIVYFDEVADSYSGSEFSQKAKEYKEKCLKMLADKELYIADFYFIRDQYLSSLGRFEDLLEKYPNLGYEPRALYGAAVSAHHLKDREKYNRYFNLLVAEYPDSTETKKIKTELSYDLPE